MEPLFPSYYFALEDFAHAALFSPQEYVWEGLRKLGAYLQTLPLGKIEGKIAAGAHLVNPETIFVGEGSTVEAGAYIAGPCYIGKHCQIRHGAYLRGNVLVGAHCVIGHATEVKNSIFLNKASAGHFAYVGDCIIGNDVNLGAGTKCANLAFKNKNIEIIWKGQRIATGLRKLGAILADHVQTGCNSVTNPGTLIGPYSCIAPCVAVKGVIGSKCYVKSEKNLIAPLVEA